MAGQENHSASPYRDIFIQDAAAKINPAISINIKNQSVREAFRRAAVGEDVVSQELIDTLTDGRRILDRSHPDDEMKYDFKDSIRSVAKFIIDKHQAGALSPESQAVLEQNIERLIAETGANAAFVRTAFTEFEESLADSPDEEHDRLESSFYTRLNNSFSNMKNERSGSYEPSGDKNAMGVVIVPNLDESRQFKAWMYSENDQPLRPPPGTVDQMEFLTALHESEHALSARRAMPDNTPAGIEEQIHEIRADAAVVRFLDDAQENDLKEYWFQWRNVTSFQKRLQGDFSHDTATFLRQYESTGREIDLEKLFLEKAELMEKIAKKTNKYDAKTGDVMGAVADILKEDAAARDPAKKLSAIQKAEAETFLRDAAALGYTINPAYPQPPPEQEKTALAPAANVPAA